MQPKTHLAEGVWMQEKKLELDIQVLSELNHWFPIDLFCAGSLFLH